MKNKIGWCDLTWNFFTGCTKISEGCQNCYAERMSKRLAGRFGYPKDNPFKVTFHLDKINLKHSKKALENKVVFVNSMSDMFHEEVIMDMDLPFSDFDWDSMRYRIAEHPKTIFVILTKRPKNITELPMSYFEKYFTDLRNLYIGVSVESFKYQDRITTLKKNWPGKKLVSFEPLLNLPVSDVTILDGIDWVIAGPETGPKKRPYNLGWTSDIWQYCRAKKIPYYQKYEGAIPSAKNRPGDDLEVSYGHCS